MGGKSFTPDVAPPPQLGPAQSFPAPLHCSLPPRRPARSRTCPGRYQHLRQLPLQPNAGSSVNDPPPRVEAPTDAPGCREGP